MRDADFRAFVKGERQRLIHYVRSLIRDTAEMDAEDVVQDVLLKLLERPGPSGPLTNLTGYVYRSIKNRVIDFSRTRKPTVSLDAEVGEGRGWIDLLEDLDPSAIEQLQTQEGERALFEALAKLSEVERRVVIAHVFEGVSFRELSSELQIPQNTLLSHKSRAIKKLQAELSAMK